MKSFGAKAWVLPQPVLIVGTYDNDGKANAMNAADGKPDVENMGLITFDPCHYGYIALGQKVGNAFADGNKIK